MPRHISHFHGIPFVHFLLDLVVFLFLFIQSPKRRGGTLRWESARWFSSFSLSLIRVLVPWEVLLFFSAGTACHRYGQTVPTIGSVWGIEHFANRSLVKNEILPQPSGPALGKFDCDHTKCVKTYNSSFKAIHYAMRKYFSKNIQPIPCWGEISFTPGLANEFCAPEKEKMRLGKKTWGANVLLSFFYLCCLQDTSL